MQLPDLDFDLPEALVAQHPTRERDACRLLRLRRGAPAPLGEHHFRDLPRTLRRGDALVRNVTRVIPARLQATKEASGARCELLLLEPSERGAWWALVRPARRLRVGSAVHLHDGTRLRVLREGEAGRRLLGFPEGVDALELARLQGEMPLPPYIRRPAGPEDRVTYQTVYASVDGSVAAPTAGLHFTPGILDELESNGIEILDLILHVGPGTFEPIRTADPLAHRMHWERIEIARSTWQRVREARAARRRIVAVGTTVARTLESLALWEENPAHADVDLRDAGRTLRGRTRLFIHPPYTFRCVDVLLTNFHLPRSTLLLLVDAFAGRDAIRAAYAYAVSKRFRFFSYGDAMLIEP